MNAALTVLQTGVKDLRWYIEAIEIEWKLLASNAATLPLSPGDEQAQRLRSHIGQGIAKRKFDYNSIVISLYGLLEQYVESLARAYAAALNAVVPRYGDLPEIIRNSHLSLSTTLIARIGQSRYRGAITAESLVANLHSCLSNMKPYRMNTDAFCYHSANFRAEVVDDVLGKIGIPGVSQRLRFFSPFSEYLTIEHPGREQSNITLDEMYFYLNDLAERRNEVAHGSPTQLLSNELLLQYVNFIESYCTSLYELVSCYYSEYIIKHKSYLLGLPIKVFNNSIVCLEMTNLQIAQGDTLIAATGNTERPYMVGVIQELQVDNKPMSIVPPAASVKVGARVAFKAKETYNYWLVSAQ